MLVALATGTFAAEPVDFVRDIQPIFAEHCYKCHGPTKQEGGIRWDRKAFAFVAADSGHVPVTPGKPEASALIHAIGPGAEKRMPFDEDPLSDAQIALLRRWVEQGALWPDGVDPKDEGPTHWSFVKPVRPEPPAVKDQGWPRTEIDRFILARLEAAGLSPSEEADRHDLIRRVTLDLTGLPPTPQQVRNFVNDTRSDAYERLVDSLLADEAFGERWARIWLDLARYADSRGFGSDPLRTTIWPYRDWVIKALNSNMPFDQFTIEQLAGDLLPEPSQSQLIATAFHRNTLTNTEGGTDDEEFRVAAVKDRVDTTLQVWMGLTMGCAQCHTHKYDPITQREYYQFYAIFNQTEDNDQADERPTLPTYTAEQERSLAELRGTLDGLRKQIETQTPELATAQAKWEERLREAASSWTVLKAAEMSASSGAELKVDDEGVISVSGAEKETDTYTLTLATTLKGITALRLEALGARRSNFAINDFAVEQVTDAAMLPRGRFVRIEVPGNEKMISLAEVQVFAGDQNIAKSGKATQSSTAHDGPAHLAIDGNTNGHYFDSKSVTHTETQSDPWWELDLGGEREISQIAVWSRTDGNLQHRLDGMRISVLDQDREPVWTRTIKKAPKVSVKLDLASPAVRIASATADFSQDGWPVEKAIDADGGSKSGWAVAPRLDEPHNAVFKLARPLGDGAPLKLQVTIAQSYGKHHTLGRFRLSATTATPPPGALPADVAAALAVAPDQRTAEQRDILAGHYRSIAPELKEQREQVAAVEKQIDAIKPNPTPVMRQLPPDQQRTTHVQIKGNFLSPGEEVSPGIPATFGGLPESAKPTRLGVAQWLISPDNPLTARVQVNRYWSVLFGKGLVETEEDFGTQGAAPSHPALLDWLATEYIRLGWDTKAMIKLIVTSAVYRQSAVVTPGSLAADPRNELLGRGPRRRLEAEMVRDQALALSGLLTREIGGPSVYPPQPDNLWQAAFNGQRTYPTSTGSDKYRRGLYVFLRRTVPYPSMAVFDAPSREVCSIRRIPTNTPLQAFVTMNDPVYVEAAQALGRRMVREGGDSVEGRITWALHLCTGRDPLPEQIDALEALYDQELEHYRAEPSMAERMATDPLGPLPEGADAAEMAAWTVVANVLLNMDAVLMK